MNLTVERLFQNISITSGGCFQWQGHKTRGYGRISVNGRRLRAHRASWELFRGEIPQGMCVLHRCDNPACVRVDHLFLGSHLDNTRDMIKKNRDRFDTRGIHGMPKLSDDDVSEIRRLYKRGIAGKRSEFSTRGLAAKFNVYSTTIQRIVAHKRRAALS